MELFYSSGGRSNPDFTYQFALTRTTESMYQWCQDYPLTGPFERFYIRFRNNQGPIIQFESKKAAYMFRIAFSEYITEDLTYSFAKGW